MKTLILGMGNTLLSDDGIGIITKRYLEKNLGSNNNIDFSETSWGGFKIIDLLKGYDYTIIIDSIKTGLKPAGFINCLKPSDLLPTLRLTSYHDINFITAIKLAEQLGAKIASDIDIFAIEIEDNETIRESLNPMLIDSITECSKKITELLISHNIIPKRPAEEYLSRINSSVQIEELYYEELELENSVSENNTKQLEQYQV